MSIYEIAGYIALVFSIGSYLIGNPRYALIGFTISSTMWGIHYIGNEALIGTAIALASGAKNAFGAFASDKIMRYALYIFLVFIFVFTAFTYKVPYDLLPLTASLIASLSIYLRDHPFLYRLSELFAAFAWLTYCTCIGSTPGMITCTLQACMIFTAMIFYDKVHHRLTPKRTTEIA